jgi:hypothetical protein
MSEDKAASNKVRKNDAARRILETDEGMRAIKPCRYCTRQGRDCRVFKRSTGENSKRVTCAFCKKSGSTGCDATNHPEHARTKATQKRTVPAAHQHEGREPKRNATRARVRRIESAARDDSPPTNASAASSHDIVLPTITDAAPARNDVLPTTTADSPVRNDELSTVAPTAPVRSTAPSARVNPTVAGPLTSPPSTSREVGSAPMSSVAARAQNDMLPEVASAAPTRIAPLPAPERPATSGPPALGPATGLDTGNTRAPVSVIVRLETDVQWLRYELGRANAELTRIHDSESQLRQQVTDLTSTVLRMATQPSNVGVPTVNAAQLPMYYR